HQVTLGDVGQPPQPTPPRTARFADVGEGPLDVLTPSPLQPLAARPADPPSVAPVRPLPGLRLVDPDPLLVRPRLGDVRPHAVAGAVRQRLRLVVALVGDGLLDVRRAAGADQVELSRADAVTQRGAVGP